MKIPLKYNLRSLWVRRTGTLMTGLGIGLTVAVLLTMIALVNGLVSTFVSTGQDSDVIVMRTGSASEPNSWFGRDIYQELRLLPQVARDDNGDPLAVGEIIVVINHPRLTGDSSNVMVRGTSERGLVMRPEVGLVEGRMFRKGVRELIASRSLSRRFQDMALGDTLPIAANEWTIVGIFEAGNTAYSSELWGDYDEIAQVWNRPIYSSVTLRAQSPEDVDAIITAAEEDRRFQLDGMRQKEYFQIQTASAVGIITLGLFVAIMMGIGSSFAAMNMMYATIMARFPEIGTLRALGFKRRSILFSFVVEAIVLALIGGVLGCILAIPIQVYAWMTGPMGSMNFITFSEAVFNFRITPFIMALGMVFSLVVGIFGGFFPAFRAARLKLIDVLRD